MEIRSKRCPKIHLHVKEDQVVAVEVVVVEREEDEVEWLWEHARITGGMAAAVEVVEVSLDSQWQVHLYEWEAVMAVKWACLPE